MKKTQAVKKWSLVKGVSSGVAVLSLMFWVGSYVGAGIQDAEFRGAQQMLSADESGSAIFSTDDESTQTLVIGFDSAPMILSVSDPLSPKAIVYDALSTESDHGAMLFTDEAGTFVAEGVNEIPVVEIESN